MSAEAKTTVPVVLSRVPPAHSVISLFKPPLLLSHGSDCLPRLFLAHPSSFPLGPAYALIHNDNEQRCVGKQQPWNTFPCARVLLGVRVCLRRCQHRHRPRMTFSADPTLVLGLLLPFCFFFLTFLCVADRALGVHPAFIEDWSTLASLLSLCQLASTISGSLYSTRQDRFHSYCYILSFLIHRRT